MTDEEIRKHRIDAATLILANLTLDQFMEAAREVGLQVHHSSGS